MPPRETEDESWFVRIPRRLQPERLLESSLVLSPLASSNSETNYFRFSTSERAKEAEVGKTGRGERKKTIHPAAALV